jgi:RNA polymerase sigma-70 factor (ECF subfamily)
VRLVRDALKRLPRHYRDVIFLVYIEGMSVREAGRTLQLPQGTIKTRLMRGRQRLARMLSRDCPDYFGDSDALS